MPRDSNGHLTPGLVSPLRAVPSTIARPEYVGKVGPSEFTGSDVYTPEQVELIRESGRIAAGAIEAATAEIRPGVTTEKLDRIAHEFMLDHGAYPSTLGYRGFPKSSCTSVNEVICHGIPDTTELVDGDLINIDVTAYKNGMHGDLNKTFVVGDAAQETIDLVERTREALNRGIKSVAPGRQINVIGRTIESYAKRCCISLRADRSALRRGPPLRRRYGGRDGLHYRADAHPWNHRLGSMGRQLDSHHAGQKTHRSV
jgi:methionyl aminopeptidase